MPDNENPFTVLVDAEQRHCETREETEALAADLAGASFTLQINESDGCLYFYRPSATNS